jgi:penicillin-binding protein 1A
VGRGRRLPSRIPVYGKTGTSQGFRDALFAGFTGHYVAVVWLGRQRKGDLSGRVTGGELPAESFRWLMATLHAGKEAIPLECREPVRAAAGPSDCEERGTLNRHRERRPEVPDAEPLQARTRRSRLDGRDGSRREPGHLSFMQLA